MSVQDSGLAQGGAAAGWATGYRRARRRPTLTFAFVLGLFAAVAAATAPRADAIIYFANNNANPVIARSSLDGGNVDMGFLDPAGFQSGVAVDSSHVYFTRRISFGTPATGAIGSSNLDGSGLNENLITAGVSSPSGIAVSGGRIYWGDGVYIGRANLDGTGAEPHWLTLADRDGEIRDLTANATHIYWASDVIGRVKLDGSQLEPQLVPLERYATGIEVNGQNLFWTFSSENSDNAGKIARANLDGSGVNLAFVAGLRYPRGLALDGQYLYWANYYGQPDSIGRAKLDGTAINNRFIVNHGITQPTSVAVDSTPIAPLNPDLDGDGIPNGSDPDRDGDGVPNDRDAFPDDPTEWHDIDGDGLGDNLDPDRDGDGIDNIDDDDNDNDGTRDYDDAFPFDPTEQRDSDHDGVGDNADAFPFDPSEQYDSDGDGVGDNRDAFPFDPSEQYDSDGDGIGDNADPDADGDGIPDDQQGGGGGGGQNAPRGSLQLKGKPKAGRPIKVVARSSENGTVKVSGVVIVKSKRAKASGAVAPRSKKLKVRLVPAQADLKARKPVTLKLVPKGKRAARKLTSRAKKSGASATAKLRGRFSDRAGHHSKVRLRAKLRHR